MNYNKTYDDDDDESIDENLDEIINEQINTMNQQMNNIQTDPSIPINTRCNSASCMYDNQQTQNINLNLNNDNTSYNSALSNYYGLEGNDNINYNNNSGYDDFIDNNVGDIYNDYSDIYQQQYNDDMSGPIVVPPFAD